MIKRKRMFNCGDIRNLNDYLNYFSCGKLTIASKPRVTGSDIDINSLDERLKNYYTELLNYNDTFSKELCTHNLKNLKIERMHPLLDELFILNPTLACYYDGTIKLNRIYPRSVLFHEANHGLSSIAQNGINYSSFYQADESEYTIIGDALCEGYTELLAVRLNHELNPSLMRFEKSALFIEKLIGRNKMINLYFTADLLGLINELEEYDTYENIIHYIRLLDEYYYRYSLQKIYNLGAYEKEFDRLDDEITEIENSWKRIKEYNEGLVFKRNL